MLLSITSLHMLTFPNLPRDQARLVSGAHAAAHRTTYVTVYSMLKFELLQQLICIILSSGRGRWRGVCASSADDGPSSLLPMQQGGPLKERRVIT